jgi:hypothetical protein
VKFSMFQVATLIVSAAALVTSVPAPISTQLPWALAGM